MGYLKNMKNEVEIDWFAEAVEEFGKEAVEDFCCDCDVSKPELFDESCYYAILWTVLWTE
jgi:enolase